MLQLTALLSSWCGPCRALTPLLEKLTAEPSTTKSGLPFDLLKIDIDAPDGQSLATKYQARIFPSYTCNLELTLLIQGNRSTDCICLLG